MAEKFTTDELEQIGSYLAEKYPVLRSETGMCRYSDIDIDIRERVVRVEEELKNQRDLIHESIKMIDRRFSEMTAAQDRRFDQVDKRFEQVDKRFEQVDKRFEQIDKRFEQVDKRFEEMRADMNSRFKEVRSDMNFRFEKMYTEMNSRFSEMREDSNTRFKMMFAFMSLGFTVLAVMMTTYKFII